MRIPAAWMLLFAMFPVLADAATVLEMANANVGIAQACLVIASERAELPDKPPQAEAPEIIPARPTLLDNPRTDRTEIHPGDKDVSGQLTDAKADAPILIPVPDPAFNAEPALGSALAVEPLKASCIVRIMSASGRGGIGSGTVISSDESGSNVLADAHTQRYPDETLATIEIGGKSWDAAILKRDRGMDLCLYRIPGVFAPVAIADELPPKGTMVSSIGENKEHSAKFMGVNPEDKARLLTDVLETQGRSGGGLFHNGKLIGVYTGNDTYLGRGCYVALDEIQSFLKKPQPPQIAQGLPAEVMRLTFPASAPMFAAKRKAVVYTGEDIHGKGWCPNCIAMKERWGSGNDDVEVEYSPWLAGGPQKYPAVRFQDANGQWWYPSDGQKNYVMVSTLQELVTHIDERAGSMQADEKSFAAAGPAGAIHDGGKIDSMLDYFRQYIGDGVTASMLWECNRPQSLNLFAMGNWTTSDMFGTSGRIELKALEAVNLPVKSVGMNYAIRGKNIELRCDPIILEGLAEQLKMSKSMQAVNPAGIVGIDDFLLGYQVFSVIRDIYSLCWPSCDLQMPTSLQVTAVLNKNVLKVDFQKAPIVRLKMLFTFSLGVKSVTIDKSNVHVEFTGSRWIKSRDFPRE